MRHNAKALSLAWLSAIAWLFFISCANINTAGTGTETENLAGILYNADGSRAACAIVKVVATSYIPMYGGSGKMLAAFDTVVARTDANGNYAIDSLPINIYNIFGAGSNGNLCYKDSIKAGAGSHTVVVPPDTLKPPGTISGVIQVQSGDDARKVTILFLGTTVWTVPSDSIGHFTTPPMGAGTYRVEILSKPGLYYAMNISLTIRAGKDSVLADTLRLQHAPVAWWSFDSTSDSIVFDGSINANTGIMHNASLVPGVKGNAVSFSGSTTSYVRVINSASLNIPDKLSVECWVYARQVNPSLLKGQTIIRKEDCYAFGIGSQGKIGFWVYDQSSAWQGSWTFSQQSIQPLTWYHVAGVWNGQSMKVYVNGVQDPDTMAARYTIASNTNDIYMGTFYDSNTEPLNGIVDELKMYNYALTADSIYAHYRSLDNNGK